jgi:hypothetical protein
MISSDVVVVAVAFLLSLALEVIPGFVELWDNIPVRWKPLTFLGLCVAIAFGLPYLACLGITFGLDATCPEAFDAAYVNSQAIVAFVAWGITQSTFTSVQAPLSRRIADKTVDRG